VTARQTRSAIRSLLLRGGCRGLVLPLAPRRHSLPYSWVDFLQRSSRCLSHRPCRCALDCCGHCTPLAHVFCRVQTPFRAITQTAASRRNFAAASGTLLPFVASFPPFRIVITIRSAMRRCGSLASGAVVCLCAPWAYAEHVSTVLYVCVGSAGRTQAATQRHTHTRRYTLRRHQAVESPGTPDRGADRRPRRRPQGTGPPLGTAQGYLNLDYL
jgi:hypothetical protein